MRKQSNLHLIYILQMKLIKQHCIIFQFQIQIKHIQYLMDRSQPLELLSHLKKNKAFTNSPQETKLFEYFISKNRSNLQISKQEALQLINTIQNICMDHFPIPKVLQVLRLLTKPSELRNHLKIQFFEKINFILPEASTNPSLLIEILALHLRFIEIDAELITDEMFSPILDLLVMNNPDITKIIIQITRQLTAKGINKVLEEVWYVGRLLFALERLDPMNKPKLVNLIRDLLECKHFNENFRRINGVPTLINQLKKSQGNLLLRISILHCIYKLLLTTKTQAIYDFKLNNFTSLISLKIKEPLNYKEMILILKILTHLMLDNDISSKYIQEGIEDAIALLVRSHPTNCHMIKFQDIQESQEEEAFQEFRLLLLRLLRYISSLDRNRKVFKQIFPIDLLAPFIDIGHFIKSLKPYLSTLKVFNQLDNTKILTIEDQYQKLAKLFANKNYKLQVVGNYNLVEELGKGGFGSVFLAKKGANQYALKRLKIDDIQSKKDNIQQLSREVKIYRALKHPNIVKFYESFVEQGYLYIVMEVIKGCDLSELIRSQSEKDALFEEDIIWRILICLLSVLRYLHVQKSIIHRDLNPSNIMVDHKFNIKVTDFGLAKNISSESKMSQSFVGTVSYSAPQIVQRHNYNEKADIWSLGCILHELMCLKPTFSGNNPLLLAKIIVNRELNAELPNTYSEQLRNFVNLCLIKQEQQRPSVTELMQKIVGRIVEYSDQLKEKESNLSDQIVQLNKKINTGGLGTTHTRLFGNSLYNSNQMQSVRQKPPQPLPPNEDMLRQTQLVKIDSEVLNKIGEDPMNKFIDITRKLSLIASTQASLKKNFKKYVVDTFYNRIIISDEFPVSQVKNELNKLINLSKEEVTFLGVKFELKQNYIKSITYEMLYFYVQQLYQLIRK